MRKLKKINGYLVVRFNDREKREYEGTGLGNFGVIDAELYTGILDVDRSVMEYDDIETLEIAMEQARGLESELDVEEPETKITVTVENETEVRVTEADPERLFQDEKAWLKEQIGGSRRGGLTPDAAAHQLTGYVRALKDLGMSGGLNEWFAVDPDTFGPAAVSAPMVRAPDNIAAQICDEICKHRVLALSQEGLDEICEVCPVNRLATAESPPCEKREVGRRAADPPTLTPQEVRELRSLFGLLKEMEDYTSGQAASPLGEPEAERGTFINAPPGIRNDYNTRKVYALGLALARECPDNDCRIYLNIFNVARELDSALDKFESNTAPAMALRKALVEWAGELWQMYAENYAVQQFKKEVQK